MCPSRCEGVKTEDVQTGLELSKCSTGTESRVNWTLRRRSLGVAMNNEGPIAVMISQTLQVRPVPQYMACLILVGSPCLETICCIRDVELCFAREALHHQHFFSNPPLKLYFLKIVK